MGGTNAKIEKLRQMIENQGLNTMIEVDGGVNVENAPKLFNAGADVLVAGNAVFKSEDPMKTIAMMKQ